MNDNSNNKDLSKANDKELKVELEKRMEKKCGCWGEKIEKKFDALEKKIPPPLSALGDVLCLGAFILGALWLATKLNWLSKMPSWKILAVCFATIFIISLVYRLFFRKK